MRQRETGWSQPSPTPVVGTGHLHVRERGLESQAMAAVEREVLRGLAVFVADESIIVCTHVLNYA